MVIARNLAQWKIRRIQVPKSRIGLKNLSLDHELPL
jgi:hypothetical protein